MAALQPDRVGALLPLSAAPPHPPTHLATTTALALAGATNSNGGSVVDSGDNGRPRQPPPVVATPDGELIFTDSAGAVQRRYLLDYPAVAAFRVDTAVGLDGSGGVAIPGAAAAAGGARAGTAGGSGGGAVGAPLVRTRPGHIVAPLHVVHRLSVADTAAHDGHGSDGEAGECRESDDDEDDEDDEGAKGLVPASPSPSASASSVVVVRALNDGGLYALEMPAAPPNRRCKSTQAATMSQLSTEVAPVATPHSNGISSSGGSGKMGATAMAAADLLRTFERVTRVRGAGGAGAAGPGGRLGLGVPAVSRPGKLLPSGRADTGSSGRGSGGGGATAAPATDGGTAVAARVGASPPPPAPLVGLVGRHFALPAKPKTPPPPPPGAAAHTGQLVAANAHAAGRGGAGPPALPPPPTGGELRLTYDDYDYGYGGFAAGGGDDEEDDIVR